MKENNVKISNYIDKLNSDEKPREHEGSNDLEAEGMFETIRKVRTLREPSMPEEDFQEKLIANLQKSQSDSLQKDGRPNRKVINFRGRKTSGWIKSFLIYATTAAAVVILLLVVPEIYNDAHNGNIAYAMEEAMKEVKAYHGIIEVKEINELGEVMLQSKREIWADKDGNYYLKELMGYSEGLITINNTKQEWQLRPEEKIVSVFPAFPDPYRFTFELGSEVENVRKALTIKEIGEETLSGRETVILEVTPDGGTPYQLWIDKETELPLKRQSAMQNALQITVSYTEIEFVEEIPAELLVYQLPKGYEEVETNPEQQVATLEEAADLAGFTPVLPKKVPQQYVLKGIAVLTETKEVKLYYETKEPMQDLIVLQGKAEGELLPDTQAMLGIVNNNPAELLTNYLGMMGVNSIRWQEKGMEYTVFGDVTMEVLSAVAGDISEGEVLLPAMEGEKEAGKPQIEVPVDMEIEENEQKSVDAGHSPWKLDPVFVAHVFANVLISPEGIVGDYPIAYEKVTIIDNNGIKAKAEITDEKTIAHYIYLERLVRKDDTGIWTVVGYEPVTQ